MSHAHRTLFTVLVAALVALGPTLGAQIVAPVPADGPTGQPPARPPSPPPSSGGNPVRVGPVSVSGTLQSVDGRMIVVEMADGMDDTFRLRERSQIYMGAEAVMRDELGAHVGDKVELAYQDVAGLKMVSSLILTPDTQP